MDSILINPKNEKELKYILELMKNIGAHHKTISREAADEFELALMIKSMNTIGIIRQERTTASILSEEERDLLKNSELDIIQKLTITELKIKTEEEEWLNR